MSEGGNIRFTGENDEEIWFAIDKGKTRVSAKISRNVKGYTNLLSPKEGLKLSLIHIFAEKAVPPLTKGLDFAAENLDVLAASAAAAFTAFKGYKVVKETSNVLSKGAKAWQTASDAVDVFNAAQLIAMESGIKSNATMTAGQTVVGLLTCLLYTSRCV